MLDKQFDNIINQKLKDIKHDAPESDWNVFSQKLKVAMESTDPSDHVFDEAIKSKLADADLDIPKPNWSVFSASLQADIDTNAISDADFDAAIKEKLTNPDIEIPKADWPVFAGMMAGSIDTPEMSDTNFDQAIQSKLQDNTMDIPSPNWNAFSQKLQEASITDEQIDTEVKSKLENYSTRYNESHWSILRDKMIETKYLRRNLYGLKTFEAALAILLFITFSNFIADRFIPDTQIFAETNTAVSVVEKEESTNAKTQELNPTPQKQTMFAVEKNSETTTISTIKSTSNNKPVTSANVANTTNTANSARFIKNKLNNNSVSNSNDIVNTTDIPTSGINNRFTPTSVTEKANNAAIVFEDGDQSPETIALSDIDGLNPGLFDDSRALVDLNLAAPFVDASNPVAKNSRWALHAVVGNNNHLISTPQDTFVFQLPYERSSNNLNFDLRISKEINQVELMTGIAFQTMQYGSRVVDQIESDGKIFDVSIASIKYDLIKIPVAARWNYTINDRLNFFADLGVSANILSGAEYDIQAVEVETGEETTKPQPIEELPDEAFTSFENSSLAQKNFQKGIFNSERASLKESIHGTLDTGIGVNYKLNSMFETYLRGTVSQALGQFEIGPNYDSFTTFGLQVGVKMGL